MGPPSLNGGNSIQIRKSPGPLNASMGPPSLNGGNLVRPAVGHVHAALASMGPPSLNGGNPDAPSPHRRGAVASMGPPSLNGGNCLPNRRPRRGGTASMGPPSLNGGNDIDPLEEFVGCPQGFNGAAVSQRRKWSTPGRGGKEDERLQWGRRLSTAEMSGERVPPGPTRTASMGPPSLNGGNPVPAPEPRRGCGRFNGAAVSQRRKLAAPMPVYERAMLQWGRRLSTAEIPIVHHSWGDLLIVHVPRPSPLQWGRRLSTAEILPGTEPAQGTTRLQWGRRLSTAEIRLRNGLAPDGRCFNGAAVSQRRK